MPSIRKKKKAFSGSEVQVGSLTPVEIFYLSYHEIENAPEVPAWYCWIHVPTDTDGLNKDLYGLAEIELNGKANFSAAFQGALKPVRKIDFMSGASNIEALQRVMLAFSPPLYIGISRFLRSRLKQHASSLESSLLGSMNTANIEEGSDDIQPDSEGESRVFGARIARAIENTDAKPSELIIKYVKAESVDQLESIEYLVNRLYLPPFGRR